MFAVVENIHGQTIWVNPTHIYSIIADGGNLYVNSAHGERQAGIKDTPANRKALGLDTPDPDVRG